MKICNVCLENKDVLLFNKDNFINLYLIMTKKNVDPTEVKYFGRDKDPMGNDFFDHALQHHLNHVVYN